MNGEPGMFAVTTISAQESVAVTGAAEVIPATNAFVVLAESVANGTITGIPLIETLATSPE